jgi:hypothetical protein
MCSDAKITTAVLVRPKISCKTNLSDGCLNVNVRDRNTTTKINKNLKVLLQYLKVCVPGLDDRFTQLGAVRDISILKIFTKEKQEIAKLSAFDNINGLERS